MSDDAARWQRLQGIVEAALERPADERAAFLAEACGDDERLRQEAASLVEHDDRASAFLATPLAALAAGAVTYSPGGTAAAENARDLIGSRIGAYEIQSRIGAGGMGEVYRARDHALHRDVAIKVLPAAFAADRERLTRFEREARLLASLNHPHIGAVYGLEGSGDLRGVVLELIDGETLETRLRQGPIPVVQALVFAVQIADALDHAHQRGVMHRDLKPANVMLTKAGAKVLDFGLAKELESPMVSATALSGLSSVASARTSTGVILGTPAYMSPEQATGQSVDGRTDIWAFGVLLFEMLSGRRPFEGANTAEVLGAVLRSEPNWSALPEVPPRIRSLVRACLQKDVRQRVAHAQDVRLALDGAFETTTAAPAPQSKSRRLLLIGGIAIAAALAAGLFTAALRSPAVTDARRITRFSHVLPAGLGFSYSDRNVLAVSPDGQRYVYSSPQGLYLRSMDDVEERLLQGTEEPLDSPFFSPDGQSVGYFQAGRLKRLAIAGGSPVVITTAGRLSGATWTADGTIFFAQRAGIMRVPASGGTPVLVVPASEGEQLDGPQLLPDGDSLLFSVARHAVFTQANRWDSAEVVIHSLSSGARRVLLKNASDARYVRSGHLVYAVEDGLHGVRFDASALEVRGGPVSLVVGVSRALSAASANYEVSDDGTLFYVVGAGAATRSPLIWVDREGRTEAVPAIRPQLIRTPRLSLDDQRVLLSADGDVRVYDLATGRETRLTSDRQSGFPAWHANGLVAYTSSGLEREGHSNVWLLPPNGGGTARLTLLEGQVDVDSWSPDGRTLAVHHHKSAGGDSDVLMIAFDGGKPSEPQPFATGPSNEMGAVFSPDGRYVAYLSNETGLSEAVIRPFRGSGPKITVSSGGAVDLAWARNGELFYRRRNDSMLVAVPVSTTRVLTVGRPQELFRMAGLLYGVSAARYAVSSDGKRFLMNAGELRVDQGGSAPRPAVQVVLNWRVELQRLVP